MAIFPLLTPLLLLIPFALPGQDAPVPPPTQKPATAWLSGYARALSPDTFRYHSPLPDTDRALLVRANKVRSVIAWESAPVPAQHGEGPVDLVWMFGIDVNVQARPFTLEVDGRPCLRFANPPTADKRRWSVQGEDGSVLTFRATLKDRHGDLMGFASLRLPRARIRPGKPIRLTVRGAGGESPAWYMTFQRRLDTVGRVVTPPALIRTGRGGRHRVYLDHLHLGEPAELHWSVADTLQGTIRVVFGPNRIPVDLPPVAEPLERTLDYRVDDGPVRRLRFTQKPVRRWTLHLVQHTHTDIGYTRPQSEILPEHLRFIDYALDWCDATDGYPDDARFRWTCESTWAVREYLKRRPKAQVDRLVRRVREGRIEVTAMLCNFSELPDETAIRRSLAPLREITARGIPVVTAMQNDVNGIAWCLADYLPALGVDYLVMGQHAHRARKCFRRPTPFWWESPAGKRVLAFRADHYMTGNTWGMDPDDMATFGKALFRYLEVLAGKGYPYDRIAVQHSGYVTDNAPPSTRVCDLVRRWNATWLTPRLRCATAREFLDHLAAKRARELPVHRQGWPDWWTDGFGSAARETGLARMLHGTLLADQALLAGAVRKGATLPAGWRRELGSIYEDLLFYGEHTFGADESIRDPLGANSVIQWGEKASYVWSARKREAVLRETALGLLQRPASAWIGTRGVGPTLTIHNPLGHTRDELLRVYIDHQLLPRHRAFRIVDDGGRALAVQYDASRSDGTWWWIWAPHVPALGSRAVTLHPGREPRKELPRHTGPVLANRHYRIAFDPAQGALTSVRDLGLGLELVDAKAPWPFLSVILERLGNRHQLEQFKLDQVRRDRLGRVALAAGVKGPIWDSVRFHGTLPDATGGTVEGEIRLYHPVKRIDLHFRLRRPRRTEPEGLYVALPFALPGGRVVYQAQGGPIEPGKDQLPGSASDWHTVQGYTAIRGPKAQILLAADMTPLVQFGDLNLGRFRYKAEVKRPHVYSWVTNNYWTTNFKADQEGELTWSYRLTSTADTSAGAACRFGQAAAVPLVGRVRARGRVATTPTLARPLPANLLLVATWPAADGQGVLFHLREVEGRKGTLDPAILAPGGRWDLVDPLERPVGTIAGPVEFGPRQVRFLRWRRP